MNKIDRKIDYLYNKNVIDDTIICHLADIHFNEFTNEKMLHDIVNYIYLESPSYIMITGDLIDSPDVIKNRIKIKELVTFLTDLSKLSKVLISLGNHDIFKDDDLKFFNKLNELNNIFVLNNESYQDENIYVSGFALPNIYYYNITGNESSVVLENVLHKNKKLVNRLPKNKVKIGLIHSPICLLEKNILKIMNEYDLLLSGHMHDGMVPKCLKFLFKKNMGIIAPNRKLFPRISRGRIDKKIGDKTLSVIITGGVMKLSRKSSIILSYLNFIYKIGLNKIVLTSKKGRYYGKN